MTALAGCLGERERPAPPRVSFTIDDASVSASRQDTVAGTVSVEDHDGLDSVWIVLDSVEVGENAGFDQFFETRYRFFVASGRGLGEQVPLTFRARDIAGFEAQRDTYVVVVP